MTIASLARRAIGVSLCLLSVPMALGDTALDSAQRIIGLAMVDNHDGRTVRVALRTLRDPALVPLFEAFGKTDAPGAKLDAMVSVALATKDARKIDIDTLIRSKDDVRIGGALAQLIDLQLITTEQLKQIEANRLGDSTDAALDMAHRVMASSELVRRKAGADHALLLKTLDRKDDDVGRYDIVRHYAAVTLLEHKNEAENAAALKCLSDMLARHNPRLEGVQELMLLRIQKDKMALALPWVEQVARDEKCRARLRLSATNTLLALKHPAGGKALEALIGSNKEVTDQIVLGLTAIEHADQLKPANIAGLGGKTSPLLATVAQRARDAVDGQDVTESLTKLIAEGQPIVLNWALGYTATAPMPRKARLRAALVLQASVLDDVRGQDFERAAVAAHRLVEDCGEDGRKELGTILKGDNRAAVEAALLGMLRSGALDLSPLVLPVWDDLGRSAAKENAANYAALILAREGKSEPLNWLAGMIQGGTVQNVGFRALAAWYYAKLKDQGPAVLQKAIATAPAKK